MLGLPHLPQLRAIVPFEETALLVVPALAACFVVGWVRGGRGLAAVVWLAITAWLLAAAAPQLADPSTAPESSTVAWAYADIVRAWGLLGAGTFGLVSLLGSDRPLTARSLAAVGLAIAVALAVTLFGAPDPGSASAVFEAEFAARNRESALSVEKLAATWPWLRGRVSETVDWTLLASRAAVRIYPALMALESLAAYALAWALYHRVSRARIGPPLAPLRDFRFDDQLVWGLAAGVAIVAIPTLRSLLDVGLNLITFFSALYVVRGLGVIAWFAARSARIVQVTVGIWGVILLPFTLTVAFALGLNDSWFDLRPRATPPQVGTEGPPTLL